jgi:hypothetical protein
LTVVLNPLLFFTLIAIAPKISYNQLK